ncbi:MAG: phosphomevalonate kinase [Micrococcaceae bacterium]
MIVTRAPGKLYIAGEYAVVEPGQCAVVVAVDRYLTVTLRESDGSEGAGRVHSSEYGRLPVVWRRDEASGNIVVEHHPYDFVTSAITTCERLRAERGIAPRYFDLHIDSELDDADGQKFGLGSSGAVVVATVSAIGEFYGLHLSDDERFRLSLLSTVAISPRSSGGDIAASTYGGWLGYASPDRAALRTALAAGTVTAALEHSGWDPHRVQRLSPPTSLRLRVGWTGSPASTEALVGSVKHHSPADAPGYGRFLASSSQMVAGLVEALNHDDAVAVAAGIRSARALLRGLHERTGITIETNTLQRLCDIAEDHGAAAKPSGAGGGDCGIVLVPATADPTALHAAWIAEGIRPLDLKVTGGTPADPAEEGTR